MGFKRNLLTSAAACMWASALLAVFMGYNLRCRATFPSRDLVVGSPASGRAPWKPVIKDRRLL